MTSLMSLNNWIGSQVPAQVPAKVPAIGALLYVLVSVEYMQVLQHYHTFMEQQLPRETVSLRRALLKNSWNALLVMDAFQRQTCDLTILCVLMHRLVCQQGGYLSGHSCKLGHLKYHITRVIMLISLKSASVVRLMHLEMPTYIALCLQATLTTHTISLVYLFKSLC